MRLSFKKQPRERGLGGVGHPYPAVDIKGDGREVGWIDPPSAFKQHYHVWMRLEDTSDTVGWRNVYMFVCDTEEEARQWVKDNWNKLKTKVYQL